MSLYCFDAAYAPNLTAVKAAGGIAINGYLTGTYATSTTQPSAARAAGLGYVPTYEEAPSELVGASRAVGQTVGRKILAAFGRLGIPLDGTVAVYPSVDVYDGSPSNCMTAWQGIRDVIAGKISVRAYAEGAVIDTLTKAGLVDGKCWLSASTGYPGYNPNDPNVCMVQLTKSPVADTDADHLITDPHALGAWWPEGSPYGAQVPLTQTDANLILHTPIKNPFTGEYQPFYDFVVGAYVDAAGAKTAASTAAADVAALAAQVTALQKQIASIQTGAVDPVALAQAIAAHVKLTAQ